MIAQDFASQVSALFGASAVDWTGREIDAIELGGESVEEWRSWAAHYGYLPEVDACLEWDRAGRVGPEPPIASNFEYLSRAWVAVWSFEGRARDSVVVEYDLPLSDLAPCHLERLKEIEGKIKAGEWPVIQDDRQADELAKALPEAWHPEYKEDAAEVGSTAALRSAARALSARRWRTLIRGGQSGAFEHRCGDLFFSIDK
jgi:hypothetical protein